MASSKPFIRFNIRSSHNRYIKRIRHLFLVTGVVNEVGHSPLDRLGELLLKLFGDNGRVAAVLGVGLVGALARLLARGMDLDHSSATLTMRNLGRLEETYVIGERLFKPLGSSLLDLAGHLGMAGSVGLALPVLVGGLHSDGCGCDAGCACNRSCQRAKFKRNRHV